MMVMTASAADVTRTNRLRREAQYRPQLPYYHRDPLHEAINNYIYSLQNEIAANALHNIGSVGRYPSSNGIAVVSSSSSSNYRPGSQQSSVYVVNNGVGTSYSTGSRPSRPGGSQQVAVTSTNNRPSYSSGSNQQVAVTSTSNNRPSYSSGNNRVPVKNTGIASVSNRPNSFSVSAAASSSSG